ncbi:MAG TPA: hypothetical protein EYP04_11365, partial [Anaerolineae bacterium]|nr:hypothetical protein [Anaerolineae bacterium]
MLTQTDQGFYELMLRCVLDELVAIGTDETLIRELSEAYDGLVNPPSPFHIPLSFWQGMSSACERLGRPLVLLLDEFDEPLARIDARVLLNLRALHDRFRPRLLFVTATDSRLTAIRPGNEAGEFSELFIHHTLYLGPLPEADARLFVQHFAEREKVTFDQADVDFVLRWAGGHPGLLEATCRALGAITGEAVRDETGDWIIHRQVAERLPRNLNVQLECGKIWRSLNDEEQRGLLALFDPLTTPDPNALTELRRRHLLSGDDDDPILFCRLFAEHIQRLRAVQQLAVPGVRMDVESGDVYVDGRRIEALTKLEYRLLMYLYGRLNKL